MTTSTNRLGRIGEQIAVRYLEGLGYQVVDRNWRLAVEGLRGEVDIVAKDDDTVVFCEVKTRRRSEDGDEALLAVTVPKQRQLRRLAAAYLAAAELSADVRFDVVAVSWPASGGRANVVHVAEAF